MRRAVSAVPAGLGALGMAILATLALGVASASATEVVYSNFNTVPAMVNGHPNQDTYSEDFEFFPFGGMVEVPRTRDSVLKSIATQVDSFACEHGVYSLENCYTLHESKKFHFSLTASVYKVSVGNEPEGAALATDTETFRIPYRPTTNVSCPATPEGKGFGANCDVGGFLATVKFKKFSAEVVLPAKFIIEISTTEPLASEEATPVNVGLQTSYKEFSGGEFFGEPPANGGVPSVGSDPLPKAVYYQGKLNEENGGWEGYQPVFEVMTRH